MTWIIWIVGRQSVHDSRDPGEAASDRSRDLSAPVRAARLSATGDRYAARAHGGRDVADRAGALRAATLPLPCARRPDGLPGAFPGTRAHSPRRRAARPARPRAPDTDRLRHGRRGADVDCGALAHGAAHAAAAAGDRGRHVAD